MSEYREAANKRRNFRQVKDKPETGHHHRKKKNVEKDWIVEMLPKQRPDATDFFMRAYPPGVWKRWGKYETEKGAQQALTAASKDAYTLGPRFEWRYRHISQTACECNLCNGCKAQTKEE